MAEHLLWRKEPCLHDVVREKMRDPGSGKMLRNCFSIMWAFFGFSLSLNFFLLHLGRKDCWFWRCINLSYIYILYLYMIFLCELPLLKGNFHFVSSVKGTRVESSTMACWENVRTTRPFPQAILFNLISWATLDQEFYTLFRSYPYRSFWWDHSDWPYIDE